MSHTLASLTKIVKDRNDVALNDLWLSKKWMFPPSSAAPPFDIPLPSHTVPCASVSSSLASASFPGSIPSPGPNIGTLRSIPCTSPCLVLSSLGKPPLLETEAVFSVIDQQSPAPEGKLDVVLCVGINYGQFTGPAGGAGYAKPTHLIDRTGMRPYVDQAFKHAGRATPPSFHLIAANFFPWITNLSWQDTIDKNSIIKESVLMHICGYVDPIQIISDLVKVVDPEYLLFHGANNCVSSLGTIVHRVSPPGPKKNRVTILCDNLSYHATWSNSVVLP